MSLDSHFPICYFSPVGHGGRGNSTADPGEGFTAKKEEKFHRGEEKKFSTGGRREEFHRGEEKSF